MPNGFAHPYHLDESTSFFFWGGGGIRRIFFNFLFYFSIKIMKIMSANRIALDRTPGSAASHLGLFCRSAMSHKKDVKLL